MTFSSSNRFPASLTDPAFPPDPSLVLENQRLQAENQRLQAQNAALLAQTWQTRFYNLSFELMCVISREGDVLEVNAAFAVVLGYAPEEIVQEPFSAWVHPDDRSATADLVQRLFAEGGRDVHLCNRYRTKGGEYRWFSWILDYDAATTKLYAVARDITEIQDVEQRLKTISESVPGVIYQYRVRPGQAGQFTYISAGIQDLYGISPEVGQQDEGQLWKRVHPDDSAHLRIAIAQVLAQRQQMFTCEYRIITPMGGVKWLQAKARIVHHGDGQSVWDGLIIDIGDRKAVEAELQQEREFIQVIIEGVSDAVVACDAEGRLKLFNQAARQWHGCDPRAVPANQWSRLYDLRRTDGVTLLPMDEIPLHRAFAGESVREVSMAIAAQGQPLRMVVANGDPLYDQQGQKVGAVVVMTDMTEQRLHEAARQRLTQNLQEAQRIAHLGNWDFNPASGQLQWSAELFCIFGRDRALGEPSLNDLHTYYHPDDRDRFRMALTQCIETGEPYDIEMRIVQEQSGEVRYVQGRGEATFDARGHLQRLFGVVIDITERRRAEERLQASEQQLRQKAVALETALQELKRAQGQLVHSEKMSSLGQLVAGIAHEINNPISFIFGNLVHANAYVEQLLSLIRAYQVRYPVPDEDLVALLEAADLDFLVEDMPKLFQSMNAGTQRIRDIVMSLRNFSRLDEAACKAVDLHEGLESTLLVLQHRFHACVSYAAIEVVKHYGDLPPVECFAGQVNQVFMNVINNAIDALMGRDRHRSEAEIAERPSQIVVSTQVLPGDRIQVCIADNGPGLSTAAMQHIFDPFFTTKPVGEGTGLSMAVSYQIITEHHGGRLWTESDRAWGTRIYIELPIHRGG